VWTVLLCRSTVSMGGLCVDGNERLDSMRGREFLYQLSGYQRLKKDSVKWTQSVTHISALESH
jgi:hypothetical protein